MSLNREKTIKYFSRHLELFPSHYVPFDSSLTSLVYFCISGLKLFEEDPSLPATREQWIEWVYSNLVESGEGFRGSNSHKLEGGNGSKLYDPANLSSTFFCLCILAVLEDEQMTTRIDRGKIMNYVKNCQRENGGFSGVYHESIGPFGESDVRHTYVACAIRHILGYDRDLPTGFADIDVENAVNYILTLQSYDGGFGNPSGNESHGGLTFCGISALHLLGRLHTCLNNNKFSQPLLQCLSKRQIPEEYGGFNGRCNKDADTCYSGWTQTTLDLLGHLDFINVEMNEDYLLNHTQHGVLGGFGKFEGEYPDPLHSFFGIASLALTEPEKFNLHRFDSGLCIPKPAADFIRNLQW